ncbi:MULTISPECIES: SDR family oxidoreductase [unclassified Oceanobacter]|uniref:SDR family oxidoreductase n=1 Tax=unclassified Oceanobacter TaxID=2620260 RepID=UPI0026E42481|nr:MULTISPECIES: SDR family oxidoreductase [unclassified Oceanobacter]MDO6680686.1 SDR family oxidoreductase [Oceanobacter sp. 5_MG-2023]MDP2610406.1 SDR family oxidoreductase [Oceanobacter sp. 1_MG-2023]MDP2613642.1 SDR family oxidoreductase [Oceanobacter sp. 2_MG-2023]
MIVVTGASGQLGRLVIDALLQTLPAAEIVAAVRNPEKVADLAALGVVVKAADYSQPAALTAAFEGADKVLLISSSEVGQRFPQHQNVIAAAQAAGVGLLAYTSILHAAESPLPLALEHQQTEQALAESNVPYVLLRNGWYTENYTASVPTALEHGAVFGCAGEGRIASAARADYAAAAAAVLTSAASQAGKVYELAGDNAYTLTALASEIATQTGKTIVYQNMPEADYAAALMGAGLPDYIATLLAESDTGASKGGLFDDSKTLSQLIGRPTTPLAEMVKVALAV